MIRRYKNEIFILCVTILFLGLNCFNYINQSVLVPVFSMKGINALSFWYFVKTANIGEIMLFLSPIMITIFSTTAFYKELSSGIYKDIILKSSYKKYLVKNIIRAYIKANAYVIILSLLIFVIGKVIFSDNIIYFDSSSEYLSLPNLNLINQYQYMLMSIVFNMIYSIIIVNLALIAFSKIKIQHIAIIRMFITLMFVNYGVYFILTLIASILKNAEIIYLAESINLFQGYVPQFNYIITFISLLCWLVISLIFLRFTLKKRERIFELYE